MRQSEVRERINGLLGKADRSDEETAELRSLTEEGQRLETEYRAAVVADGETETEATDESELTLLERRAETLARVEGDPGARSGGAFGQRGPGPRCMGVVNHGLHIVNHTLHCGETGEAIQRGLQRRLRRGGLVHGARGASPPRRTGTAGQAIIRAVRPGSPFAPTTLSAGEDGLIAPN